MGMRAPLIRSKEPDVNQSWPMQPENQGYQGGAAQTGEEYGDWLEVYYSYDQE